MIDPVLFQIGPLQIRYYGILYALAFLVGYFILKKLAPKRSQSAMRQNFSRMFREFLFPADSGSAASPFRRSGVSCPRRFCASSPSSGSLRLPRDLLWCRSWRSLPPIFPYTHNSWQGRSIRSTLA